MISINAKPFYEGLKFRSSGEGEDSLKGECEASECTLICQDLWKRGYYKIAVDPLVKVYYNSYSSENFEVLERDWLFEISPSDSFLRGKVDHIEWNPTPPSTLYCCPLLDPKKRDPEKNSCLDYPINYF